MGQARRDARIAALAVAALVAAVLLRGWLSFHRYFDTDELTHLHAALLVSHGAVPFRDFFGHHGPLFWGVLAPVAAAGRSSLESALAGRALMTMLWASALGLLVLPRKGEARATRLAAAALCAFFGAFLTKSLEVRPDMLALPLLLGAWRLLERGGEREELAAGVLLGLAGWSSPKAVFTAAGLLAGHAWRARRGLLVVAGTAAAAVAGILVFAALRGLGALWSGLVLYNASFPGAKVAWSATFGPSLAADGPLWALGLGGLRRWREEPLVAGALAAGFAGLFLSPSAYPQYLLFVAPFLAVFAARGWLEWLDEAPVRGAVCGLLFLVCGVRSAAAAARADSNALQRERFACVDELPASARVWDSWGGDSFARPHASRIWFVPDDAQSYYDPAALEKDLVAGLSSPSTVAAVRCESCLARLPAGVRAAFDAGYRDSGCGRLWIRR